MISAVSMARGMTLESRTSARTRPDAARWSRSAAACSRPRSVRPAQPRGPAMTPWKPASASPWRTSTRRISVSPYGLREETLVDRVEAELLKLVDQSEPVDQSECGGTGGAGGGAGAGGAGAPLGDGEPEGTSPEPLELENGRVGAFARAVLPGIALGPASGDSISAALLGEAGLVVATDAGVVLRSTTPPLSVPWSLAPGEPVKRATVTGAASAATTATAAPTMYALCEDLPLLL